MTVNLYLSRYCMKIGYDSNVGIKGLKDIRTGGILFFIIY
ncbi:hypothetical protein D1BOALGB6SA_6205 [Olavius sp. associated proteobacterium Delta 1]|nr:hypothetical protein D1BOALGB6SA_6205 [Olavius sp. associated proteobacterium Delta 1]